jgi:hypothetical protein
MAALRNPRAERIIEADVMRAREWLRWLGDQAMNVYRYMHRTDEDELVDVLAAKCESAGRPLQPREFHQKLSRAQKKSVSVANLRARLIAMVDDGRASRHDKDRYCVRRTRDNDQMDRGEPEPDHDALEAMTHPWDDMPGEPDPWLANPASGDQGKGPNIWNDF